jgi:hypothetical protein
MEAMNSVEIERMHFILAQVIQFSERLVLGQKRRNPIVLVGKPSETVHAILGMLVRIAKDERSIFARAI